MCRVMIIFVCVFMSVISSFADDSDIISALRGEGLMLDSAADRFLADPTVSANSAAIQQKGTNNKAITYQHGSDNMNSVTQVGQGNSSLLVQIGTGNEALITQKSSGSYSAVTQIGAINHADITQSTNGSYLVLKQIGTGGSVIVR